jgi:hypothetical protein
MWDARGSLEDLSVVRASTKLRDADCDDITCILSRTIAAIQTTADRHGAAQLGVIARLPAGNKLTLVGSGFNDRTVKVCCQEALYFVFLEDLDKSTQEAWAATRPRARSEFPALHA